MSALAISTSLILNTIRRNGRGTLIELVTAIRQDLGRYLPAYTEQFKPKRRAETLVEQQKFQREYMEAMKRSYDRDRDTIESALVNLLGCGAVKLDGEHYEAVAVAPADVPADPLTDLDKAIAAASKHVEYNKLLAFTNAALSRHCHAAEEEKKATGTAAS